MVQRTFYIIGAGLGDSAFLTMQTQQCMEQSELVLATSERLQKLSRRSVFCPYHAVSHTIEASDAETVAVLVSGDTGFYSLARTLAPSLSSLGDVHCIAGISSMQYFCARLCTSYDDAVSISLHGRTSDLLGAVSYHKKVILLTDAANHPAQIAKMLCDAGITGLTMSVGEMLGSDAECITVGNIGDMARKDFLPLSVVMLENPAYVSCDLPLFDAQMLRDAVPMTKETIRWTSVARLNIHPQAILWDVGAGSGSVSIEMARKAHRGVVYAIEDRQNAFHLLNQNRRQLGGYNVIPVLGQAPEALKSLPAPDAVFIGGSRGKLRHILTICKAKNPSVRVVINAVTLETLELARTQMQKQGFTAIEITQIAVTQTKSVGSSTMLQAENPVFIISGEGQHEG